MESPNAEILVRIAQKTLLHAAVVYTKIIKFTILMREPIPLMFDEGKIWRERVGQVVDS